MVEIRRRRFRAMELITILNRCHRFRGFVYQHAYFVRNFQRAFIALSAASRYRRPDVRKLVRLYGIREFEEANLFGIAIGINVAAERSRDFPSLSVTPHARVVYQDIHEHALKI